MRESLNLILTKFYLFKVNLFVRGAGRRLDQRNKQLLAVVFYLGYLFYYCKVFIYCCWQWFLTLRSVASGLNKPLLAG